MKLETDEIATSMKASGFVMEYADEFHNTDYQLFDTAPITCSMVVMINYIL